MFLAIVTLVGMLAISGCKKAETYTVTFNSNGGTGLMADQIFIEDEAQALARNAFTYDGYTFAGWNTVYDGSGTAYSDGQTIKVVADMTLYAQWRNNGANPTPGPSPASGNEFVDLGLPSGLLWASCNVGASSPEDYGNYYSWGEISTKSTYSDDNYRFGTYSAYTKYCSEGWGLNGFYDNKTTLEPSDDAATANMGDGARTPTKEEWDELVSHTTYLLTTRNGVTGCLFTGSNGKSIFLPAAGYCRGELLGDGAGGMYQASTLVDDNPAYVWGYLFDSNQHEVWQLGRTDGYSVRAVRGAGGFAPSQGGFDTNGASNALFSVSASKKIHFSRGNLQYKASTSTWRFAESQLDYVGDANAAISASNSGWIDLFAYGTSGWNSGVEAYQPYSSSPDLQHYLRNVSLTGSYAEADWGWHNAISNGGNQTHTWRTMSSDEWQYLLGRPDKWGLAIIGGTHRGMIILPDNWTTPNGLSWTAGHNSYGYYDDNAYTASQWQQMEDAGAIFLPAAGDREGEDVFDVGYKGNYWSSSHDSDNDDYSLRGVYFSDGGIVSPAGDSPRIGYSVRLVKD